MNQRPFPSANAHGETSKAIARQRPLLSRIVCRARHNFSFAHALCRTAARPILPKDRTASH